jgi:hypothetical protein
MSQTEDDRQVKRRLAELLTAMDDAIDRVEAAVRRRVDAGDPNSVAM